MLQADRGQRHGCRPRARILLFVIVVTAIALAAVAIYTLMDRPTTNRLTPAGANYNPGQTQDSGQPH